MGVPTQTSAQSCIGDCFAYFQLNHWLKKTVSWCEGIGCQNTAVQTTTVNCQPTIGFIYGIFIMLYSHIRETFLGFAMTSFDSLTQE